MKQAKISEKDRSRWIRTGLSVAERILIAILDELEDWDFARRHQSLSYEMGARDGRRYLERLEEAKAEKQRRQEIRRLIERKWVLARQTGERMEYLLTKDGKIRAIKAAIRQMVAELPDGMGCAISYDFPEAAKVARREFRRFLKQAQFQFSQKSLWKTKKDIDDPMKELVVQLGIEEWVQVLIEEGERR
jgi:hypothetical protein